jgi:hypothetical protein
VTPTRTTTGRSCPWIRPGTYRWEDGHELGDEGPSEDLNHGDDLATLILHTASTMRCHDSKAAIGLNEWARFTSTLWWPAWGDDIIVRLGSAALGRT